MAKSPPPSIYFISLGGGDKPKIRIPTLHTLYTHSAHTLRTLYAHSAHTLRTLYAHSAHTLHTLYAHSTHTLHTLCTHREEAPSTNMRAGGYLFFQTRPPYDLGYPCQLRLDFMEGIVHLLGHIKNDRPSYEDGGPEENGLPRKYGLRWCCGLCGVLGHAATSSQIPQR